MGNMYLQTILHKRLEYYTKTHTYLNKRDVICADSQARVWYVSFLKTCLARKETNCYYCLRLRVSSNFQSY